MIEIEFEQPQYEQCECCGRRTTRLTRFVYQNGDAFAVYYVLFTDGHDRKVAYALIGLGEWGESGSPEQRAAFSVKIWADDTDWKVNVTEREESPWADVTFLGEILSRDEALRHPWIEDVFHITDHIVTEDEPVIEYFSETSP